MHIILGSDHGGFNLKSELIRRLREASHEVVDNGCYNMDMVDYPIIADDTARPLLSEGQDFGIPICGTGIGTGLSANKIPGIRAAHCGDSYSAKLAKAHNHANIITLGGRTLGVEPAWDIVQSYMDAEFLGGIHGIRVAQNDAMVKE